MTDVVEELLTLEEWAQAERTLAELLDVPLHVVMAMPGTKRWKMDTELKPKLNHDFVLTLDGEARFVMDIIEKEDTHVKVAVSEVTSWPTDLSNYAGWSTEEYLEATIKWDGCCHVWFADEGYVHICGVQAWKHHCAVMEWIYKTAFVLIDGGADDERWE